MNVRNGRYLAAEQSGTRLPGRVRKLIQSVLHGVVTSEEALGHGDLTQSERTLLDEELAKGLVPVDLGHA